MSSSNKYIQPRYTSFYFPALFILIFIYGCCSHVESKEANPFHLRGIWIHRYTGANTDSLGNTISAEEKIDVLYFKNDSMLDFGNEKDVQYTIRDSCLFTNCKNKFGVVFDYKILYLTNQELCMEAIGTNSPFYIIEGPQSPDTFKKYSSEIIYTK